MIIIVFFPFFLLSVLSILFEILFRTRSAYEEWLRKKLEDDPAYINWLKVADGGKDYKLGLKCLKQIRRKNKWNI